MDVRGGGECAEQGPLRPGQHGHGAPGEAHDGAGVGEGVGEAGVAPGHGYQADVQLGAGEGQEQRDGVVGAGVAVDDDGSRGHAHSPARMTGSDWPLGRMPSTSISLEPIIQSMWMRLVLAPRRASSSSLASVPPVRQVR